MAPRQALPWDAPQSPSERNIQKMKLASCLAVLVLAASVAVAQCSTLAVTGSVNAGQTVAISVTGATPNAIALLAAGPTAGTTNIHAGTFLNFTIDLAQPFVFVPLGMTNATGDASISVNVPANIPAAAIHNATFTLQAVTVGFSLGTSMPPMPTISTCVSNTATLVSGTG